VTHTILGKKYLGHINEQVEKHCIVLSHCCLLFNQEHLKNYPKNALKHISLCDIKCARVLRQGPGLYFQVLKVR